MFALKSGSGWICVCLAMLTMVCLRSADGVEGWMMQEVAAKSNALVLAEAEFGLDNPALVDPLMAYADALFAYRSFDVAVPLYERAIEIQKVRYKNLKGDDLRPIFLKHMLLLVRIGDIFLEQNKDYEALEWYDRAQRLSQRGIDSSCDEVRNLRTVTALANVYRMPFEQVEGFYQQLYRSAKKAYPRNHPDIALVLGRWCTFVATIGKVKDAIKLAEDNLKATERGYGAKHPRVADAQSRLASLYFEAGGVKKVRPLLEAALEIRRNAFGEDHPLTLRAKENLKELTP